MTDSVCVLSPALTRGLIFASTETTRGSDALSETTQNSKRKMDIQTDIEIPYDSDEDLIRNAVSPPLKVNKTDTEDGLFIATTLTSKSELRFMGRVTPDENDELCGQKLVLRKLHSHVGNFRSPVPLSPLIHPEDDFQSIYVASSMPHDHFVAPPLCVPKPIKIVSNFNNGKKHVPLPNYFSKSLNPWMTQSNDQRTSAQPCVVDTRSHCADSEHVLREHEADQIHLENRRVQEGEVLLPGMNNNIFAAGKLIDLRCEPLSPSTEEAVAALRRAGTVTSQYAETRGSSYERGVSRMSRWWMREDPQASATDNLLSAAFLPRVRLAPPMVTFSEGHVSSLASPLPPTAAGQVPSMGEVGQQFDIPRLCAVDSTRCIDPNEPDSPLLWPEWDTASFAAVSPISLESSPYYSSSMLSTVSIRQDQQADAKANVVTIRANGNGAPENGILVAPSGSIKAIPLLEPIVHAAESFWNTLSQTGYCHLAEVASAILSTYGMDDSVHRSPVGREVRDME